VAVVFGLLAALALVAGVAYYVYKKKQQQQQGGASSSSKGGYHNAPTRSSTTDYVRASDTPMRSFNGGNAPAADAAPLSSSYRPPEQLV
jgi:hypothetical protein